MEKRVNIFLTFFLAAVLTGWFLANSSHGSEESSEQVSEINVAGNSLFVGTECYRLEMLVSDRQAELIEEEFSNGDFDRPPTHRIVTRLEDSPWVSVDRVEIKDLVNGSYRADLIYSGLTEHRMDIRPSDGVLVAYGTGAQLKVDETLLREQGVNRCLDGSVEL